MLSKKFRQQNNINGLLGVPESHSEPWVLGQLPQEMS
jgi:hypothetical protein